MFECNGKRWYLHLLRVVTIDWDGCWTCGGSSCSISSFNESFSVVSVSESDPWSDITPLHAEKERSKQMKSMMIVVNDSALSSLRTKNFLVSVEWQLHFSPGTITTSLRLTRTANNTYPCATMTSWSCELSSTVPQQPLNSRRERRANVHR